MHPIKKRPYSNGNKPTLTEDGNFEVKESIVLNLIVAVVICPILCYEMCRAIGYVIKGEGNYIILLYAAIFLLGMILIFRKLFNRKPIILVNQKGVYIHDKLVTNWKNFINAQYTQKDRDGEIEDNFILLVYYYKDDGEYYVMETPLSNTQNKAEEEVVEAIKYFYSLWQRGQGVVA